MLLGLDIFVAGKNKVTRSDAPTVITIVAISNELMMRLRILNRWLHQPHPMAKEMASTSRSGVGKVLPAKWKLWKTMAAFCAAREHFLKLAYI